MSNKEVSHIIQMSDALYAASKHIRILRNISWPLATKEAFFASGCDKMPEVTYPTIDTAPILSSINVAKATIPQSSRFANWANHIALTLENAALMLGSLGTKDFYTYSDRLYGSPQDALADQDKTSLDLARHLDQMYRNIDLLGIESGSEADLTAEDIQLRMKEEVTEMFGDKAPKVIIDNEVSSKAIAGRRRIRIRKGAMFSDLDIEQLIHHEAFVHVATSINGHEQEFLKILGASHPGTTKTQEGLAVFAEYITGHLDLERLRRLSDRIIAIQMAIDGADFIEVYRYYLSQVDSPDVAYENTRRVFRGGVLTGGAPFTKDIVYLDGLLNVHNFLRAAVSDGRADILPLLFVGKINIEDIGEIIELDKLGLVTKPAFLPPWIKDIRFLLTYLAYSSFLNTVKLKDMKGHYLRMIDRL